MLMMPRWAMADYLASGELVELTVKPALTVTRNPNLGIFLLYQKQRYQVPKIKAAVDFLVTNIRDNKP
jgi:DNA-binding transcriptional LysR family regulator